MSNKAKMVVVAVLWFALMGEASLYAQEAGDKSDSGILSRVNGYASLKFRYRVSGSESDMDLYEYLNANVGDAKKDKLSFNVYGRMTEDLDGNNHGKEGFSKFDSITDTYKSDINARLYSAYANVRDIGCIDYIRIGRQSLPDMPVNSYFDGGRLTTAACKDFFNTRFTAYGGLPVHFFESSRSGDGLAGAALEGNLIKGNVLRGDLMYIKDKANDETNTDTLWSLNMKQSFEELTSCPVAIQGKITSIDNNTRDLYGQIAYDDRKHDLLVQYSYATLWNSQNDLVTEFDPYFSIMRAYHPYDQFNLSIYKGFGEHIGIEVGGNIREVKTWDELGEFNRDFKRFYVSPSIYKWPTDATRLSLTGEMWDSDETKFLTYGFDVEHKLTETIKGSIGTDYQLYKYDYYSVSERDHVRTYFVKADWKAFKNTKLNLSYTFESGSYDNYSIFEIGLKQVF